MPKYLSVVVPAFDEEARLGESLVRIADYLRQRELDGEIVVVDDGSSDRTAAVARDALSGAVGRVVSLPENRGKGAAVRRGIAEARGRWVLLTDADLSTPIEDHERLAETARNRDVDVVIGSRGLPESDVPVPQSFVRRTMGKTFNVVVRMTTGLPYRDTQCGFKLLDRARCAPLFETMVVDRFAFDVEFLFLCGKTGLTVAEVPVTWRNAEGTKVGLVGDPARMLTDIARVRWRYRRGMYAPDPGGS